MKKVHFFLIGAIIIVCIFFVAAQGPVINMKDYVNVVIKGPITDLGQLEVMTISKAHYEIHEGEHYFVKTFVSNNGGSGTCDYFAFTSPDTDTRIHAKTLLTPDIDYLITIYEDGDITNGVPVTGINNDRNSANVAELLTVAAPTINDAGTPIWVSRNGGSKDPIGVSQGLNYEIIAKTNSTYVFELCKQVANDGIVNVDFWWYEEDED